MIRLKLLSLALLCGSPITHAILTDARFEWTGDLGYSVVADFTYESSFSTVFAGGIGPLDSSVTGLESLSVDIFDPLGGLIQSRDNVVAGASDYPYFQFVYHTATKELDWFDVGSDPGWYLKFQPKDGLFYLAFATVSATTIDTSPDYLILDSPVSGSDEVSPPSAGVPDTGWTWLMLSAALVPLVGRSRRK